MELIEIPLEDAERIYNSLSENNSKPIELLELRRIASSCIFAMITYLLKKGIYKTKIGETSYYNMYAVLDERDVEDKEIQETYSKY